MSAWFVKYNTDEESQIIFISPDIEKVKMVENFCEKLIKENPDKEDIVYCKDCMFWDKRKEHRGWCWELGLETGECACCPRGKVGKV